jgi:hypothetical protein
MSSFVVISLLFIMLGFYAKAYKLLVESKNSKMTGYSLFQITKWPITIVLCLMMCWLAFFCGTAEQIQWPSSHGHYIDTNTKTHTSAMNDATTGTIGIP